MEIIEQYRNVFLDCIDCYLENYEEEVANKITSSDKDIITNKLIYASDSMWDVINEQIDYYLKNILLEKEDIDNEDN